MSGVNVSAEEQMATVWRLACFLCRMHTSDNSISNILVSRDDCSIEHLPCICVCSIVEGVKSRVFFLDDFVHFALL